MGALETNTTLIYGVHLRESANDGSDFTNAAADYRIAFIGEDGVWHLKDSSGTVTTPGLAAGAITSSGLTMSTARLLGRTTASSGAVEEITVGSGLSLAAGALTATGGTTPASARHVRSAGDYTTSSTSWASVDGTNFSLTISTGANRVMVGFVGSVTVNNTGGAVGLTVSVDGTDAGAVAPFGLQYMHQHATVSEFVPSSFVYLTDTLTAASHTFLLRWAVSNGAHQALMGGSTPTSEFWVAEIA